MTNLVECVLQPACMEREFGHRRNDAERADESLLKPTSCAGALAVLGEAREECLSPVPIARCRSRCIHDRVVKIDERQATLARSIPIDVAQKDGRVDELVELTH